MVFSKVLSVNFLHASVQGHSSLFLQKPLDVGLDGVENVMCKYWFGLIFSILISNWLCFLFLGWGGWFVKTLVLFWNVISKFVCFFKCLLSLGNIPKAENCLTHSGDSLGALGSQEGTLPFFPFSPSCFSTGFPAPSSSSFSSTSSILLPFLPSALSPTKVPRNPGGSDPLQITGLGSIVLASAGWGGSGGPVARVDPKLDNLTFLTSDLFPQPN